MPWLAFAIAVTIGVSFICSLLEAVILSTTVAEIEGLRQSHPRAAEVLERLKLQIDDTISAILTLNTVANGLGSVAVGALGFRLFGERTLVAVTIGFGVVLLIGSEVLPKNLGVTHRKRLQPLIVFPLLSLCRLLAPVTWFCNLIVRPLVGPPAHLHEPDEEIKLLAQRGAKDGSLGGSESSIIANALSLDDVRVAAIMTPRTVVTSLPRAASVSEVFRDYPNLPFGRMPVSGKNLDDIVGVTRRRDLLNAKANDQDTALVEHLMQEAHFIPETVTLGNALQVFLKTHQKMLVVVDEFGATAGVVTMEDVIEHILGREIFEKDDLAVDMRELARSRVNKQGRGRKAGGGA